LSSEEIEDMRRFDELAIVRLTGLSHLKLYDPETSECLMHEDEWPSFVECQDPEISILIPAYNKLGYTFNCLQSVKASCSEYDGKYEVIVVDDGSTDRTTWLLSRIRGLKLISSDENMGYVRSNNLGVREARGKHIVLLNNDTIVTSRWLEFLVRTFKEHSKVGAVGSKLIYPSGVLQEAGSIIWNDGTGWNYGRFDDPEKSEYQYVRDVDYCSAASLMVDRNFVRPLGIFDERFHPGYYEDTDLCFFIRSKGGRVLFQPKSVAIHFEGVSHGRDTSSGIKKYQVVNREKFVEKWKRALRIQYTSDPRNVLRARDRPGRKSILVFDHRMLEYDTNSGDLRMYSILQLLKSVSWNVTFYPASRECVEPYAFELRQRGIEVFGEKRPIEEFLVQRRDYYDIILLSRVRVAAEYIDAVTLWHPQSTLIVDFPDLESLRESRYAKLVNDDQKAAEAEKLSLKELDVARRADLVITITEAERRRLLERDQKLRVRVLPNIHDVIVDGLSFDERKDLLYIGGFEHPPNVDAVLFFVKEIFPLVRRSLPSIELLIVGSKMPDAIRNIQVAGVRVVGYVKDLAPLLSSCRVFVAPLRYGAGLKGKIGMAMAAGLPVVTSSTGAEGIETRGREVLLVGDSAEEFAKRVVQLYTDRNLWEILSRNAKSYAERRYSPHTVRQNLLRTLKEAHPVNLKERVCRILNDRMSVSDPLSSLLSIYYLRRDLRNAFPEAKEGDYRRLVHWAASNVEGIATIEKYREWYTNDPWTRIERLKEEVAKSNTKLQEEVAKLNRELKAINQSLIFKMLKRIARIADASFPDGTLRGDFRLAVIASLRVVSAQGWKFFLKQALYKLRRREFRVRR